MRPGGLPVVVEMAADPSGVYQPRGVRVPVRDAEASFTNGMGRVERVKLGDGGFYVGAVFAPVGTKGA